MVPFWGLFLMFSDSVFLGVDLLQGVRKWVVKAFLSFLDLWAIFCCFFLLKKNSVVHFCCDASTSFKFL